MVKRLVLCAVLVALFTFSTWAAMTNTLDGVPDADWWSGAVDSGRDEALLWGREIETILEAWTLGDDTADILTFPVNGGTFDNATDTKFEWNENSDELIWTFGTNTVTVSSSDVTVFDYGTITLKSDTILLDPLAAHPTATEGRVYYDDTNDVVTYRSNSAWVTVPGSSTAGGTDTLLQYNDGGTTLGGITGVIYDDTNVEFADDMALAFGTDANWTCNHDDSVDDQLLWETAGVSAAATTDPMFEILVDTGIAGMTADQQVFGVAKGSQSSNTALFTVDEDGDAIFAGDLTVSGTFYQAAIAAAASGNVALALDGAGSGTVGINQTGTGNITLYRDTTCSLALTVTGAATLNGNCDIGNAASDTITITGKIDGNLNIDDDSGASPSVTFTDGTGETVIFAKVDTGLLTITSSATGSDDGVQITGGSFRVGNGSNSIALDGEDCYVEGTFEVDGLANIAGAVTLGSTLAVTDTVALAENVTFTVGADEYMLLDADTTEHTETAGVLDINLKSKTDNTAAINLAVNYMAGGGDHDVAGILIDLDDDADAAAELVGIEIASSDDNASAVTKGIKIQNTVAVGAQIVAGVAMVAIDVDAPLQTQTAGTIDIDFSSVTNGAEAVNIDVDVGDTQAGSEIITGILIDLDDDTASQTSAIRGFSAISTDVSGEASTVVTGFYTSGCDAALDAVNGWVAIGAVASADVTPGDDDLYVEGTLEVDGAYRLDGNGDINGDIVGAGPTTYIVGMSRVVEEYIGAGNTITIAESGSVFTNEDDGDASLHTLPEASTAIGCVYTFVVTTNQNLVVDLDGADIFLHLTLGAGDKIQSSTVGDTITVVALDDSDWAVLSVYPLDSDWADGGP